MTLFEKFSDRSKVFMVNLHTITSPLPLIKCCYLLYLLNFSEPERQIAWFKSFLSHFNQTLALITFIIPRVQTVLRLGRGPIKLIDFY
jgi:hypothetical protein